MPEFLTKFSDQITNYWNKFSRIQKIQIIGIFISGLAALVILTLILSRPHYVLFMDDVLPGQMSLIKTTLDENNITYIIGDDATDISVDSGNFTDAKLILSSEGILSNTGFKWQEAFNTSLTTSSDDREMMQQLAFENELGELIGLIDSVEEARVKIVLPDDTRYVLNEEKEASASIMLKVIGKLSDEQVYGIASFVESAVENLSIQRIKIFDSTTSKLLFNGGSGSGVMGNAINYMEIEREQERNYARTIESLLLARGEYDDAVVSVNLKLDFDAVQTEKEENTLPEGMSESLATHVYIYESTGVNKEAGGVPGTDSNADTTTYVTDNASGSESTVSITEKDLDVNKIVTRTVKSIGNILHKESTVTVVLNKFVYYKEVLIKEDGSLDNISWEKYKEEHNARKSIDVNPDITTLVSTAANIDKVFVLAYEVPIFEDEPVKKNQLGDIIPIIVIVLMIGLLGYAVYKGTEPDITEVEPELSVEEILSTTQESEELESIEYGDKSEARIQIEKFVDENPEAVAQLLRNWLNEDWE